MAWPSIQTPTRVSASHYKKQFRSEFEDGSPISRAAHKTGRRRWQLEWDMMSSADLASLISAFETDQGSTFSWTEPVSSDSFTVGYSGNEIQYSIVGGTGVHYSVSVGIEER